MSGAPVWLDTESYLPHYLPDLGQMSGGRVWLDTEYSSGFTLSGFCVASRLYYIIDPPPG